MWLNRRSLRNPPSQHLKGSLSTLQSENGRGATPEDQQEQSMGQAMGVCFQQGRGVCQVIDHYDQQCRKDERLPEDC